MAYYTANQQVIALAKRILFIFLTGLHTTTPLSDRCIRDQFIHIQDSGAPY